MASLFAGPGLDGLEAELGEVNAGKEMFSFAEHNGRERQMHFVDCDCGEMLTDRCDASTDSNVLAVGGSFGLRECGLGPFGHEEKRCAAFHR